MEPQTQPDFRRLVRRADFYLVRHGESEANRSQVIQGRENAGLSERGREHARAAGAWFQGKQVDAVYCSPLSRARETAELLCNAADLPAPRDEQLIIELDTGIFSGLAYGEIRTRYPEEWNRFQAESWEAVPGAESVGSLRDRAIRYWNHLVDKVNGGSSTIVTVSHAGMIQWLIKVTVGSTKWMPLYAVSNCGIFHLVVQPVRGPKYSANGNVLGMPGVETSRETAASGLASGRASREEAPDESPVVSYFAEWRLMNLVPW